MCGIFFIFSIDTMEEQATKFLQMTLGNLSKNVHSYSEAQDSRQHF